MAVPASLGVILLIIVGFDLVTVRLDWRPREGHPPALGDRDVFEVLRARRSCRSFQSRDLTADDRSAVLSWASTQVLPQNLLGGAAIRLEYLRTPLTVWPAVGAHEFLVAIAPRDYDRTAVIDVGRSLQKVVIACTRAGISTCWIGPGADQSSVAAALGERLDLTRDHVICVCAVGYRSRFVPLLIRVMNAKMHHRLPLRMLFFVDDDLTRPLEVTSAPYQALERCYEGCRWAPSSYNGQTTRARVHAGAAVDRVDFVTSTASRYYAPVALGIWLANWEAGCTAEGVGGRTAVRRDSALTGYGATWQRAG